MAADPPLPAPGFRERRRERKAIGDLPDAVGEFYERALELARSSGDEAALRSVTRPENLAELLRLADGAASIVELGTCAAWTSIALALNEPGAKVVTFDPVVAETRTQYLELVPAAVRERIAFFAEPGADGAHRVEGVDFLFVDSTHERAGTVEEFTAWSPKLHGQATVVFDGYGQPDSPGVAEAIDELGLRGEPRGSLYVWRGGRDPR